jgi:hypothetical protein
VTLKGSTVSVSVNGSFGVSTAFNALTVDGRFGLLARDGAAFFDTVKVKTNDPAFVPEALLAAQAAPPTVAAPLSTPSLQALRDDAVRRLSYTLDPSQLAALADIALEVADLPGLQLGDYRDGMVLIDVTAAGHGWFIDPTPLDDREFVARDDVLAARSGPAARRMDLLTVLAHELGHAGGLEHGAGLMAETLDAGIRLLPPAAEDAVERQGDDASSVRAQLTAALRPQPPAIDWHGNAFDLPDGQPVPLAGMAGWRTDFTSFLGRTEAERDPNAQLKVLIPGAEERPWRLADDWDERKVERDATGRSAMLAPKAAAKMVATAVARIGGLFR